MLAPLRSSSYSSNAATETNAPGGRPLRGDTPSLDRAARGPVPGDRRGEVRRTVRLGCHARKVGCAGLVGDRAVDLSPQGMLLLSDEPIDPGTELAVSFFATELPIWFDTRATVARVVLGRRPGDPGRALGLRFGSLSAVSRLILRAHLRRFPLTQAQRDNGRERDPDYAQIVKDIYYGP